MTFASKTERDDLIKKFNALDARIFPADPAAKLSSKEKSILREQQLIILDEYSDRLPRVNMSVCPYCGKPLKRAFDPYGLDGFWWHVDILIHPDEPEACEHFKVLLGALSLNGRTPKEAVDKVEPGPEVPFVIPFVLDHPGMIAVLSKTTLETRDIAYPIAYFSDNPTKPTDLYQPWCRDTLWFEGDDGNGYWALPNHQFDFNLGPYLRDKRLRWVDLTDPDGKVFQEGDGRCPFVDLPGERERQRIMHGQRQLFGLPTGETLNPFE